MGLWFLGIGDKKRGRQPPFLLRIIPLPALLSGRLPKPIRVQVRFWSDYSESYETPLKNPAQVCTT